MLKEILLVDNGGVSMDYPIYSCNLCNCDIECAHPMYVGFNNYHLCVDCAFKQGKYTSKEYLKKVGGGLDIFNVAINKDGDIEFWLGNKIPPWERKYRDRRNSPQYKQWRTNVYERDSYTCQVCKQVGGNLNAHHIKSYKNYPKLRIDANNGVTLCKECHKRVHKKR